MSHLLTPIKIRGGVGKMSRVNTKASHMHSRHMVYISYVYSVSKPEHFKGNWG